MEEKLLNTLSGKTVLVTEGAGSVGRDVCLLLASFGCRVVVASRDLSDAAAVASIINSNGGQAHSVVFDPEDEKDTKTALSFIYEKYGPINIVVNNFGFDSLVTDDVTNKKSGIYSQFLICNAIFPLMKTAGGGQIINIAPTFTVQPRSKAKRLSQKHGILSFSNHLYDAGRPYNIAVTALIAGGMKVNLREDQLPDLDEQATQDAQNLTEAVVFILTMPRESIVPEVMVLPLQDV
jgi:NAD(P)-dependent dehydrogenase (short-subunit alcohol dehydrogenase family)